MDVLLFSRMYKKQEKEKMKDKYGNEMKVGDEVAFAFYNEYKGGCCLQKAPIKSICEDTHSVVLDLRGLGLLSWNGCLGEECKAVFLEVFETFGSEVILVKRKEEK